MSNLVQKLQQNRRRIYHALAVLLVLSLCIGFLFKLSKVMASDRFIYFLVDGAGTDEISNTYASILFWDFGFQIYKKAPKELLEKLDAKERVKLGQKLSWPTKQIYKRPGAELQPMPLNWSWMVRGYPPGCFLLHAPAALVALNSQVDPFYIVLWLVILYTVFAFLASAELAKMLFKIGNAQAKLRFGNLFLACVLIGVLSFELVQFAASGFYDTVALFFLIKSFERYQNKKWDSSILYYGIAFFLHFRAVWFFPLPLICCWQIVKALRLGDWRKQLKPTVLARVLVAVVLGGIASYCLIQVKLNSARWAVSNKLFYLGFSESIQIYTFMIVTLCYSLGRRLWTSATLLLSMSILWIFTPQMMHWHSLHIIPLVLMFGERRKIWDVLAAFIFYYLISPPLFETHVFDVAGKIFRILSF